ncbi:MAG TPA: SBBP repeat-containing protein, partial [Ignavibacteria bacterium]|nr:SBBP repeat-containing protein [Ignavibacteria bacterium]
MKNLFIIAVIALTAFNISYSQVTEDWVQRFTSDSIRNEGVNDMCMDAEGNIYVTGYQRDVPLTSQIQGVTVKYNSQGVQQWIQNYQSPENNGAFLRAVHADAAGNVYVTGENAIYSGGSNEALIIKYNSSGTQLWSYRFQYVMNFYAGGFDIITDADGNVYVTGEYGNGGNNIFLIKFSSSGNLVNQTFYNSGSEGGRKIGLDGAGKIIVGGYINDNDSLSFIALKYEQNLDFVWASRWGHNIGNTNTIDMTIDNNSNVIMTGTDGDFVNYSTVKFDPSGSLMWGKQYNSATGLDICRSVDHDIFGNIYVTGETGASGFPAQSTMTTIKYDVNGNEIWVNSYDGGTPGVTGYSGYDIFIGDSANVFVTGNTSSGNIVTAKINTSGVTQWGIIYSGPVNGPDLSTAVIADINGNVYT